MRLYGLENLQSYIRNHINLAKHFEELVAQDPRFEVMVFFMKCLFSPLSIYKLNMKISCIPNRVVDNSQQLTDCYSAAIFVSLFPSSAPS